MWALRLRAWAREAEIRHGTSALGERPCLSLALCARWDAPQATQMALAIHEHWRSLGATTLTLTQNGSCFVRRARPRLAAACDVKHPALTTSSCPDALVQDPSLSPFEQAAGLAYWLASPLPGSRATSQAAGRHAALRKKDCCFLHAYTWKKGSKAHMNAVAYLNVLPKGRLEPSR